MKEKQIKALISLLDDEDESIFQQVEDQIISLGESIIPFLEDEWESNFNPMVQRRIEDLIHQLQYDILLTRLNEWVRNGADDILEGMWIISTYQYPDLEYEKLKGQIDQLYYDVWKDFKDDLHPFDQIKQINNVLFQQHHFSANTKNFHSPSNSMLNQVLETRRGNPISLCVIYMIIARKLNLPIHGVNLPNLFVLIYDLKEKPFYVNVFNKGLIFSREDIDNYIQQLKLKPIPVFYEPCDHSAILRRVLRNLMVSYEKLGDTEKIDELKEMLEILGDD